MITRIDSNGRNDPNNQYDLNTRMKTLIITFSQTGNTRRVAGEIRQGILAVVKNCELIELKEVDPASLKTYDLVGIGCPVFYYQEPLNVKEFIGQLPQLGGQPWFVFCTHGAIMGITLQSLSESLERKGARVIGCHDTYAGATLPFYPYPMLTAGHPDETDLEEARIFGRSVAERCRLLSEGENVPLRSPPAVPQEWHINAAKFTPEFVKRIFPELAINTSLCSRCHECQSGCPVDGIDIDLEPPRIQNPCIHCWNCVNICPEAAIEADWSGQVKLAPKLLERYRYWLNAAAAQEKFRWRIDPESIDFENPYYLQRRRAVAGKGSSSKK